MIHSTNSSPLVTPQTPECGFTTIPSSTKSPTSTSVITFSEAVRRARIERDMAQSHLAEAVGISANTLQRIEQRKGSPSLAIAAALAIYLKLPADTLLTP